jgi:hypothetical protein
VVEVEVVCADPHEHRGRVEERSAEAPCLGLTTWEEIIAGQYSGIATVS